MNTEGPQPTLLDLGLGVVLGGVVLVGALLLLTTGGFSVGSTVSPGGLLAAISIQTLAILAALVPLAVRHGHQTGAALGLQKAPRRRAYLWLPIVFVAAMAGHALVLLLQTLTDRQVESPGAAMLEAVADQPGGVVSLVVGAILLAPLGEELLFRGLLFGWLRRHLSFIPAGILQAIPFGLLHGSLDYALYASLLGFVLAQVRERTGSLRVCIAAHVLVNASAILFVYLGTVAIDPGSPGP